MPPVLAVTWESDIPYPVLSRGPRLLRCVTLVGNGLGYLNDNGRHSLCRDDLRRQRAAK